MSTLTSPARACVSDTAPNRAADLLAALWTSLIAGDSHVWVAPTNTHYELLVSPSGRGGGAASLRRELAARVFDRVLRGERQKVAALSLALSPATIAQMVGDVAMDMNLEGRFSRLPAALAILAHAAQHPHWVTLEVEGELSWQQQPQRLVRVSHCQRLLGDALATCQRDVASQFLEGATYAQIAERRRTSVRTVANQVSSVFRAFGVTGRFELLRALSERSAGTSAASSISIQVARLSVLTGSEPG
jgi:DNA-binding CsgD family transcriptional regulator